MALLLGLIPLLMVAAAIGFFFWMGRKAPRDPDAKHDLPDSSRGGLGPGPFDR
jgi:hypothetical protein